MNELTQLFDDTKQRSIYVIEMSGVRERKNVAGKKNVSDRMAEIVLI